MKYKILKSLTKTLKSLSILSLGLLVSLLVFGSEVSAIFYGTPTSSIQQSGYIFVELEDGGFSQCGINYVSERVGITAAHCLDEGDRVYAGTGRYSEQFISQSPRVNYFNYSPEYSDSTFRFNPGRSDVGVVVFDEEVELSEYAFVESPEFGCDYYIVGYGRNQNGSDFSRTGVDTCITNISEHTFELEFEGDSHFCVGDSGSGIYQKGTNKIVGVVSAFYTPFGTQGCENAVAFVAARLDSNLDYLDDHIPSSAFVQEDLNLDEDILPDDYFGDLYPETRSPDGGFDYEQEILKEIEELVRIFEDIYPDEEELDDRFGSDQESIPTPRPTRAPLAPTIAPIGSTIDDSESSEAAVGFLIIILMLCCCAAAFIVLMIFAIAKLSGKNKKQPNQIIQNQTGTINN